MTQLSITQLPKRKGTNINMEGNNWKTKMIVMGAIVGSIAGMGAAYLMIRTAEESEGGPPQINTTDAIKAILNVIGLVRGIAALGGPKK
jgi:hypothetical protein